MPGLCPCCGQELPKPRLRIELGRNLLFHGQDYVRLSQREMQCFMVLARGWPEWASIDQLFFEVFGESEPESPQKLLASYICTLRKKLQSLGFTIISDRNIGYSIRGERENALAAKAMFPRRKRRDVSA